MAPRDRVDVCVTTAGGREASGAIAEAGGCLGIPSHKNPPAGLEHRINFVDWPFEHRPASHHFTDHRNVVRDLSPRYAVAPDVDGEGFPERTPEQVYEWADELAQYADVVIVVPKIIPPSEVPDRFRVGIPFQERFGGLSLGEDDDLAHGASIREQITLDESFSRARRAVLSDFSGRPTHILGGRHADQLTLRRRPGMDVRSLDGAGVITSAQYGRIWLPEGEIEVPEASFRTRVLESVRHLREAWNPGLDLPHDLEVPELVRELLAMEPDERRRELAWRINRGPPPIDAEARDTFVNRFLEHYIPDDY